MTNPLSLGLTTPSSALCSLGFPSMHRSGCVFERGVVHERARSRIDPLLLSHTDYASLVEVVGLYDHQSCGRSVFEMAE